MKKACLNLILIFINAILSGVFSERLFGVFFVASILMIVVAAEAVRDDTGPGASHRGLGNKQIAEKLYISEGTVKNYISSIYDKTDIHDRVKLVVALKG